MGHHHSTDSRNTLLIALLITGGFAGVELAGGWLANSLALMGDAGHMATDALALGLGAIAATVSRVGASRRYSYGLRRAEVLGALINVLFMYGVIAVIAIEAVERLQNPQPVGGLAVMVIAAIGLLINLLVLRILHGGHQSLNTRGAMLHVIGDLLGSVGALAAGLIVWLTDWTPIDPILSLAICGLIFVSSTRLLLESVHVVMEGVPPELSPEDIRLRMEQSDPAIQEVHHLHIWAVSSDLYALSAHVVLSASDDWTRVFPLIHEKLKAEFGIEHATLQPEMPKNY
ncbi:MAG: cation diffusion facilitator family transporter [Oceanococcus sp.]